MSTQNTTIASEEVIITPAQAELKDALTIVELEERFEMTAAAEDAARCMISKAAAV